MQTFLPSGYSFSPDKLINFNDYNNSIMIKIVVATSCAIILGSFFGIVVSAFIFGDADEDKKTERNVLLSVLFTWALVISLCTIIQFQQDDWRKKDLLVQDFAYPVTKNNLVVKCHDVIPKNQYDDISNIPQTINDSKKYPYELYVKQANLPKRYLGTMQNGHFHPGATYAAVLFYKYAQYVHEHHLENKFKHALYFTQSGKYIDGGKLQWILTNKQDTVLHLVDNTVIKESKVVEN